jgi:hypothetical protein
MSPIPGDQLGDRLTITHIFRWWDSLAGWYAMETKLNNAILLTPLDGERSRYVAIDLARLDERFLGRQLFSEELQNLCADES